MEKDNKNVVKWAVLVSCSGVQTAFCPNLVIEADSPAESHRKLADWLTDAVREERVLVGCPNPGDERERVVMVKLGIGTVVGVLGTWDDFHKRRLAAAAAQATGRQQGLVQVPGLGQVRGR